jgi:hypothetical protein
MAIRYLSMIALGVISIGLYAWIFTGKTNAQQPSTNPWDSGGPSKIIDAAARSVNAQDSASVRALTEAVFSYPHVFSETLTPIQDMVKAKVTQAELQHLQGTRPGVTEEDIVRLVNSMADHLKLPEYARTTQKQVRVIRMGLALDSPAFIGRGMTRSDMQASDSVNPEMSPLQALHVAAVLVDQKFINPDFQVTPAEWDSHFHQKALERIQEAEARKKNPTPTRHSIGARNNPKRDEMRQAFANAVSSMSDADGLNLASEVLKTLKLDQ